MCPAKTEIKAPPIAPAIPPMLVTELMTFFGNASDTVVKILADHAWCEDAARLIKAIAPQVLTPGDCAKKTGITRIANKSMVYFLALNGDIPFLIIYDEIVPPQTLPMVVDVYMITRGIPNDLISSPAPLTVESQPGIQNK